MILPQRAGNDELAQRFAREAMVSPNIASALDYGALPEGGAYLVMQRARGRSLRSMMDSQSGWELACEIGASIADALPVAHGRDREKGLQPPPVSRDDPDVGLADEQDDRHHRDRLERCRRGDRSAMGEVLRGELPNLERFVARLIGPHADVDDLVQMTLERAIEAFPRYRGEASVRTWLARIGAHVVLDHLRRRTVRRTHAHLVVVTEPGEHDARPDRRLDARRRLERLYLHFDALPPKNRLAFQLHVIDGRPVEEVAAIMGTSRVTTRSRVFLARRALLARVREDPALADVFDEWGGVP